MSASRRERRKLEHLERRAVKSIVRRLRNGTATDTELRMLDMARADLQRLASQPLGDVPPGVRVVAIAFDAESLSSPRLYLPLDQVVQTFEAEGNGQWGRYLRETPAHELPALVFGTGGDCQVLRLRRAVLSAGGVA